MSEPETMTAQPSAGAQGEAVGVDRDWMIKVIRERSLPQDAADMIIGAMRFAATPAQPDTGDVAALREAPFDREYLAEQVRIAWVRWAETQPDPKQSWLVPYAGLSEPDKEADRQIGEHIQTIVLAALSKPNAPGREG